MNWFELRPLLREKFGSDFGFYNDVYRSGIRRIKIVNADRKEMINFIKEVAPNLNVNYYGNFYITIHYDKHSI